MDPLYRAVERSATLEGIILDEIRRSGPIPFARFMELALYHPTLGYYPATPHATTRTGDFLTSPETHPAFGLFVARFAAAAARAMGGPSFTVVEQGPGTGALAEAFTRAWDAASPGLPLRYVLVEPDPAARDRLHARLGSSVEMAASLDTLGPVRGLYLSNELPDAFPVHRARMRSGALEECFVEERGGRLGERWDAPVTPGIVRYLEQADITLGEVCEIEANLALGPWIAGVSRVLETGYVLTIDYGYEGREASRFPRGTLLAHYRHGLSEDLTARPGRQDLTAHVCWTAIERLGERAGLTTLERTTQREFLTRWGWKDFARGRLYSGEAGPAELDALDRLGRTVNGLGGLGVLLQAKGVVPAPVPEVAGPQRPASVVP